MEKPIIGIVGAGIGGLALAVRLASAGCRVEVFEQNPAPGGKMDEYTDDGFRFDAGPSLFTLPELVGELFDLAGTPPELRLKYSPLLEVCRYHYPDGKKIIVPSDPDEFARAAEEAFGEPAPRIRRYLQRAADLYNLTARLFLFSPFQKLSKLFVKENAPVAAKIYKLRALTRLHNYHRKSFLQPHTVQLFDRYATYNGSSPYKAPATLYMISHLEHNLGAFYPEGGMRSIVQAVFQEAVRLGVRFHFNTQVLEIVIGEGIAKGIRTDEKMFRFDHVVSNADIFHTYKELLPGFNLPRSISKQDLSTSAVIFYWGVNKTYPPLGLHNILFTSDYKGEFAQLFGNGSVHNDPTVYIYISSKSQPGDAPPGCENWFVMVNAAPDHGQYTQELIGIIRALILKKIRNLLDIDLQPHILSERMNTPTTLAMHTNALHGALYGTASNSMWSAFLRHPNFSRKIRNLWFTGGTVHPGGGIPLCLASAQVTSELILEQISRYEKKVSAE
jgi:diapolycopene oxygenase